MKKILIVGLALCLTFGLAACGNKEQDDLNGSGLELIPVPQEEFSMESLNESWGGGHQIDGSKLTLAADVDFTEQVDLEVSDITIDLAGHTINYASTGWSGGFEYMFNISAGTVMFTDSVGGGKLVASSPDRLAVFGVFGDSVVTAENITVESWTSGDMSENRSGCYGFLVVGGNLTLTDMTFNCDVAGVLDEEDETSGSDITINSGVYGSDQSALGLYVICTMDESQSHVVINGGDFQGDRGGLVLDGETDLIINGGRFSSVEGADIETLLGTDKTHYRDGGWDVIE